MGIWYPSWSLSIAVHVVARPISHLFKGYLAQSKERQWMGWFTIRRKPCTENLIDDEQRSVYFHFATQCGSLEIRGIRDNLAILWRAAQSSNTYGSRTMFFYWRNTFTVLPDPSNPICASPPFAALVTPCRHVEAPNLVHMGRVADTHHPSLPGTRNQDSRSKPCEGLPSRSGKVRPSCLRKSHIVSRTFRDLLMLDQWYNCSPSQHFSLGE